MVDKTGEKLRLRATYFDEKWSKSKPVTSLHFHPQQPEFFLAGHTARADGGLQSSKYAGSCVLVYSIHLPQRAAYTYQCQVAAAFSRDRMLFLLCVR